MDLLAESWLSEIEMDDSVLIGDQWQIELSEDDSVLNNAERVSKGVSHEQVIEKNNNHFRSYASVQKFISQNAPNSFPNSADENIISFGGSNCNSPPPTRMRKVRPRQKNCRGKTDHQSSEVDVGDDEFKRVGSRTPLQAQEHVLAERKRRETLSQRFIALAAMIPGLKRTGKASLIEGTINYLKELQERIKILEEEKKRKYDDDSSVDSTKRSRLANNRDGASSSQSNENFKGRCNQSTTDIEVRTSDRDVIFRVCCKKRTGITVISDCASLNLKCSCR